jgi:lipopolysaccharide cholinephosphotransferase
MSISNVYILSSGELNQLQAVLLEMLIEVDRVCKKNGIRYCIIAGTLLGAVRHGGFIPWDDDLDVGMMRSEYARFRDACERDLDASRFFFQDHTTDPHYRWGYGRIRRKNSEFIRVGQEHMRMRTGIFLDVFPLDCVPENKLCRGAHNFYCFILRKLLYAQTGTKTGTNAILRALYRVLACVPVDFAFHRLEHLSSAHEGSALVRILTFPLPAKRRYGMKREWFEELADISFEGRLFPGTKDVNGFLTYYYGNYMTLPPEDQRRHHSVSRFRLPD